MASSATPATRPVAVWDGATRAFHWLLVLLIPTMWATAEWGWMEWHRRTGYVVMALLLFRLAWGVVGSSTARFASFVKGPGRVASYAASLARGGHPASPVGHNPLGGWSVAAMLAVLVAQVTLGLFASDVDGLESGPLSRHIDFDTSRQMAEWHEAGFSVLMLLILLHLAAILFHVFVKKDNILAPMIGGTKEVAATVEPMRASSWPRLVGAIAVAGAAAIYIAYYA